MNTFLEPEDLKLEMTCPKCCGYKHAIVNCPSCNDTGKLTTQFGDDVILFIARHWTKIATKMKELNDELNDLS